MHKVARMLRRQRPLLLNWFGRRAPSWRGDRGFNSKVKLTLRKAYGFRTLQAFELALCHTLGALPELEGTHSFS